MPIFSFFSNTESRIKQRKDMKEDRLISEEGVGEMEEKGSML